MWVRVDDDVIEHPKTYRLARLMGTDRATALGLLVAIWGYASRHHHDGDITDLELSAIHQRVGWTSAGLSAGVLDPVRSDVRSVLVGSGYADRSDDGRVVLHDWEEHQGPMIERREKDKKRKELARRKRPQDNVRPSGKTSAGQSALRNGTVRSTPLPPTEGQQDARASTEYPIRKPGWLRDVMQRTEPES